MSGIEMAGLKDDKMNEYVRRTNAMSTMKMLDNVIYT